ncbi:hypothetical protein [Exiguobacterium aestuarii]|uniref:hypothetical protein n=1 Tax=Exiguobacterium aestuarii TaxID=273527 RepID=UPI001CD28FFA|nr:hypothetical protein [Exiguobacterium aestuarii]MCA0981220.1 hypothetical protein [Exiguobacterium aestuarii]
MDSSFFFMIFRLTMQSFSYWMIAILCLALGAYLTFYLLDRERANVYRTWWRISFYAAFLGFTAVGYVWDKFMMVDIWKFIAVALFIMVIDFGLMARKEKTNQKNQLTEEQSF